MYLVYLEEYPTKSVESTSPFTITVEDACGMDEHNTLSATQLSYQEYTITENQVQYQFEAFITELDWCNVVYTYEVIEHEGLKLISFDSDSLTFSFENSDDLTLSGTNFKSYTVTVTGATGYDATLSTSASFTLVVNNPCVDSRFLTIEKKPFPYV